MPFQVKCSKCKQVLQITEEHYGREVGCPKCSTTLKIPDSETFKKYSDELVGKTIQHYKIELLLGEGGMGKVYKAKNLKLNKTCALKVLPENFAKQDEKRIKRFIMEAQASANIDHTNVLPVQYIGNQGDTYFIEMTYIQGKTLDDIVKNEKIDLRQATKIIRNTSEGLQAAHEKGIIHRDIKPSNIMISDKDGHVYVVDFGLAKTINQATSGLTVEGTIAGTPLYMSPEQCQSHPVDNRSDIYSLGAVFYQILAGKPPYMADHPLAVMNQHVSAKIPDIRDELPDIPEKIASMIKKMMAKTPEERYQSCSEIAADLEAFLEGCSELTQIIQQEQAEEPQEEKKKSYIAPVLSAAALIAVIGIGGAIAYFNSRPAEEEKPETIKTVIERPLPKPVYVPDLPITVEEPEKPEPGSQQPEQAPKKPEPPKLTEPEIPRVDLPDAEPRPEPKPEPKPKPNLEQILLQKTADLRKNCFDRVNSGIVEISMGDFSRRFKFYGKITGVDDDYITAGKFKKKWSELKPEEIAGFYKKASDPKNPYHLIAAASILMQGDITDDKYQKTLFKLKQAEDLGMDISRYKEYFEQKKQDYDEHIRIEKIKIKIKKETLEIAKELQKEKAEEFPDTLLKPAKVQRVPDEKLPAGMIYLGEQDGIPTYKWEKDDSTMIYVPQGLFTFGHLDELNNLPVRIYCSSFFIDANETTNDQFREFLKQTGYKTNWRNNNGKNKPVTNITYKDILAYCNWVGKRLPTEIEWEKAARGLDNRKYPGGGKKSKNKSPLGCFGMCNDISEIIGEQFIDLMPSAQFWYLADEGEFDENMFMEFFVTPREERYILKGKSTISFRESILPDYKSKDTGFRCAIDAKK